MADTADSRPASDAAPEELHVYYVDHIFGRVRPRLYVSRSPLRDDLGARLLGDQMHPDSLGRVALPEGVALTRAAAERAAWLAFGSYDGTSGRPVSAEFVELDPVTVVVGEVAAALARWPKNAGQPATPAAVAHLIGRHPDDVADAFRELLLTTP